MPRPSVIRAALAGVAAVLLGGLLPPACAPASAAPADDGDPLEVHLDTMDPALPRSGDVVITGTVTNVSDETFTRINLHAFASPTPILSSASLTASATTDPAASVGERIVTPGTFDTIETLAPGESATFTDTVPLELLGVSDEPGVYWIGIHALGDSSVPRDQVADGRARTFIPSLPRDNRTQDASIILPIRNRVWFDAAGRVGGAERWAKRFAEGGSLDGVLDMAQAAAGTPYDWMVDPAVLWAITRLSLGNPTRTLAPDPSIPGQEPTVTPTETSSGTGTPDPTETLSPALPEPDPTEDSDDPSAALGAAATDWLARFRSLVGTGSVLALPYGDLDVSAAVRHAPQRYDQALARTTEVMSAMQIPFQRVVAPLGDVLSPEAIAATPTDTLILMGDNAFADPTSSDTSVAQLLGHKVVVTSTGAESGGPGPTAANDPLALRQRVLSEAALRLVAGDPAPLVVTLPTVWRGRDAESFFSELDQSWLDLVPVATVATGVATELPPDALAFTDADLEAELPSGNFTAAERATDRARLLEEVLTLQTTIEVQVEDETLVTLSEQHRDRPRLALQAANRIDEALREHLGKIEVEAPPAVTLSSDSGNLGATLVNGLDEPVTVRLSASTDGQLTLSGDDVRQLGPNARSVVRFEARTEQTGVHRVRLAVTTIDGVPLGATDELPIRAAQVSALIWVAMAAGALVLFGMIGYRLPGQIRARRAEQAAAAAETSVSTP